MDRKNFIKSAAFLSAIPFISSFGKIQINSIAEPRKIKPKRLKNGDTIGLIAPGSFITESELKESVKKLENLGFNVVFAENILKKYGYLAGTDAQRTDDVNYMFENDKVDGIVCARGGYGCTRILPMINYDIIKSNPKIFIGYSDVTALLYGIYSQTGLVCFHGPVGISTFNQFSIDHFRNVLMEPENNYEMNNFISDANEILTINSGSCQGELVGGNLTLVNSLIGTNYDINTQGKILFLEEIGEEPYKIDRMLTQLIESGKFKNAAGLALGVFEDCEAKKNDPEFSDSLSLVEVLYDRLYGLEIPVLYGLSFGHISNKFTIPFGIKAQLNTFSEKITLLENAVI